MVKGLKTGDRVLVTGNPMDLRTGLKVSATTVTTKDFLAKNQKSAKEGASTSPDPHSTHPAQSPAAKSILHDSTATKGHSGGGGS